MKHPATQKKFAPNRFAVSATDREQKPGTPRSPILDRLDHWMDDVTRSFSDTRCWDVLPADGDERLAVLDVHEGRRSAPVKIFADFLAEHPFLEVIDGSGRQRATLHTATQLLWWADGGQPVDLKAAKALLADANWAEFSGWRLPKKDELWAFATAEGNPHRVGGRFRLSRSDNQGEYAWLTATGMCDVDDGCWGIDHAKKGSVFACEARWAGASKRQVLKDLLERGLALRSPDGKARLGFEAMPTELRQLLGALTARGERLRAGQKTVTPGAHPALAALGDIDWRPSRLPRLEAAQLADPNKGLWELWGAPAERLAAENLLACDPARDLRRWPVGIDFGTSSTVVALDDGQRPRLLRVGARDFYAAEESQHFENPTVLECLDFQAFRTEWTATAYRPAHDWDWMRVGHEAQASWRDNPGDTDVLGAILPKMKQWALRGDDAPRLRLFDRKTGAAVEIPPLADRTPVRGQPLAVAPQDPFDPVEFYAFQLGMVINWRNRGLFTRYYLSFPVKYEKAVKRRILASFARGLQRSLPQTLIDQGHALNEFTVEELASEPAAYAAAALRHLELKPTEAGLAYAVFDFGGGTTDFDFGIWRWATPEEEDAGYQEVFEHLHSSGDNFLGGENLLEHLAFQVLCSNLDALRGKRIHFVRPLDGQTLPAAEAFIQPTQAAQTNVVMLMTRLRRFWESEDGGSLDDQIKIDLLDAQGQKQAVELALDRDALDTYLRERIERGAQLFLHELARAFEAGDEGPIHVLLAGNGCRSRHIRAVFDPEGERWKALVAEAFGEAAPPIHIHPPLPLDPDNPHAPTAKTGVALGLLRLAPGRGVKVVNRVRNPHGDEAPFKFFVGRLRRGSFQPALTPSTPYGQWHELGPVAQGVFDLRYTTSLRAQTGMTEGDPELSLHSLPWPDAPDGARLWARAVAPRIVELCCLPAGQTPDADTAAQRVDLSF